MGLIRTMIAGRSVAVWFLVLWVGWVLLQVPYTVMRGLGDNVSRPWSVESVERAVFFGSSPPRALQNSIYERDVPWLDFFGFLMHGFWFGIPFAFGIVLMLYARRKLLAYLGWQIALFQLAAVFFFFLPVRPPWMEDGVVRVLLERNYGGYTGADNNPMAAFPSLHAGLPFMTFLFLWLEGGPKLRFFAWLALAFTAGISFSIVYMGEHWVIDVIGGYAVAIAVAVLARSGWASARLAAIPGDPVGRLAQLNARLLAEPAPTHPPMTAAAPEPDQLPRAA